MYTQYHARRDEDGTWSIVDVRTGKIAVIAEAMTLKHLDETTAMEIMDALHPRKQSPQFARSRFLRTVSNGNDH